jgi:hypothetical protein
MQERELGEGNCVKAVIELISQLDARKSVGEVDWVQVVTPGLFPRELHVHQTSQHWRAVHTGDERLKQVVHRRRRDRSPVNGECLHNALRSGIEAAESFAD